MEPIGIALVCAFTLCIFLFAVRSVCLRVTRSKRLEDALPFTWCMLTIRRADDAGVYCAQCFGAREVAGFIRQCAALCA